MRASSCALGTFLALTSLSFGPAAFAFCRTSSCPGVGTSQICTPPSANDCGIALAWGKPCVTFSIQKDASKEVSFADTEQVVKEAFNTWMNAACTGGGKPLMAVTAAEPAVCRNAEYNKSAANANIILFRDDVWPYEGSVNTLALTTVTYNRDTGEIYDADMELNSADNHFTIGDTAVQYDLLSIVTHETGHFLGLAHTPVETATMYPTYQPGTIHLRDISSDDIDGICAIYPPGNMPSNCDPTPRHGFSVQCADQQGSNALGGGDGSSGSGRCTVTQGGNRSEGRVGYLAAGFLAVALAARRRRAYARR